MLLTDYKLLDLAQWQQLLSESPVASWFQSPEAYAFFCSLPELMQPFIVAVIRSESSPQAHPNLKQTLPQRSRSFPEGKETSPRLADRESVALNNRSFEQKRDKNKETSQPLPQRSRSFPEGKETLRTLQTSQTSRTLQGLIVGYVTKEHNPLKQFFTRRAIIYGGPLLADDITDEELAELLMAVTGNPSSVTSNQSPVTINPIFIETRNFNDYSRWRHVFEQCGFRYQPHYDMHILCSDREQMQNAVAESKMRNIRKSLADGIQVSEAADATDVHEFYLLLKQLYKSKVRTPLFEESFFQSFVKDNRGVLLLVRQADNIIGGMLCPMLEGRVLYEWYVVGPAVVTWAAMQYAHSHALPIFDLMGAGEPGVPYGVRDFKLQFGGKLLEYGRFLHITNRFLYGIGKLGVKIMRKY